MASPRSRRSTDLATASASHERRTARPALVAPPPVRTPPRAEPARRRRYSTLTLRVLAPNVLALLVLIGGVLWLDRYRDGLIDAKIRALQTQAEIIAGALGESAVEGPAENVRLSPELARSIVRRLAALYSEEVIGVDIVEAELAEAPPAVSAAPAGPAAAAGPIDETLSQAVERHLHRQFEGHPGALPPAGVYGRILHEVERPMISLCLRATRGACRGRVHRAQAGAARS